jgi:hypothetical protein
MINYELVLWKTAKDKEDRFSKNIPGMALAYVINNEVVHTDVVDASFGSILCSADSFSENSIDEIKNVYMVDIVKDSTSIETVICDEMIYSLLMSDPKVFNIDDGHEYAALVKTGWKYIDDTFKLPGEFE